MPLADLAVVGLVLAVVVPVVVLAVAVRVLAVVVSRIVADDVYGNVVVVFNLSDVC